MGSKLTKAESLVFLYLMRLQLQQILETDRYCINVHVQY